MSGGRTINTKPVRRPKPRPPRKPNKREQSRASTTLYRREVLPSGRVRYVPNGEMWDQHSLDHGEWLISSTPGRTCWHRLDEPGDDLVTRGRAALVAASRTAEDAMVRAMLEASRKEPNPRPATARERRAWKAYCDVMGSDSHLILQPACVADIVTAGIEALIDAVTGFDPEDAP